MERKVPPQCFYCDIFIGSSSMRTLLCGKYAHSECHEQALNRNGSPYRKYRHSALSPNLTVAVIKSLDKWTHLVTTIHPLEKCVIKHDNTKNI